MMSLHTFEVRANRFKISMLQRDRVIDMLNAFPPGVKCRIICFGSSVKGTCMPWSDLDLAIETPEEDWDLFVDIKNILRKSYYREDLDNNKMDFVYINQLKEDSLIKDAIKEGVLLLDWEE